MSGQGFCEQCGAALAPHLRFCERCGAPVRAADAGGSSSVAAHGPKETAPPPAPRTMPRAKPGQSADEPRRAATARLRPGMLAAAALLAASGMVGAWWLLRPASPGLPGAGLDLAPSVYDDLPAKLAPAPPLPAEAPPLPDDPLARARERRERAYDRYTRMAIGEIDGDIDAARRELTEADAALQALEGR